MALGFRVGDPPLHHSLPGPTGLEARGPGLVMSVVLTKNKDPGPEIGRKDWMQLPSSLVRTSLSPPHFSL